ncbi:hypothetical protein M2165_001917 [Variovorax sp. TBS-050B]|uniref:hypothetical protein n=1 Tax=Variovorax sp. TBS-050B TaxID=2940551 RepID=UPI002474B26A|nr:hypothetical protein [Variovorax sp. TBS-050B]MDH6592028.1 hypothetical protein [Variovorax sp. TBS-050B]
MLLFFSVARSASTSQAERANEAQPNGAALDGIEINGNTTATTATAAATEPEGEKMPTDKLVDVSPLALRMSSPFNAGYWLAAA